MSGAEEVKFSLKVMINKEKTKVLFAESDGYFVDVLLSFLTLPLGRIVKLFEKHYGAETPIIGCLNTLCNSIVNLDSLYFRTENAKQILINPISSFDADCKRLKLNISDSEPCEIDRDSGVFTIGTTTFIITDDLQIVPKLDQTVSILNITETQGAESLNVTFGLSEIMDLFTASIFSDTPLSDVILGEKREAKSVKVEYECDISQAKNKRKEPEEIVEEMTLRVIVQKSTKKFLCARGYNNVIDFLISLVFIPLGGVERLLAGNTCLKGIDNLYLSLSDPRNNNYFKSPDIKKKLIQSNLANAYVYEHHTLFLDFPNSLGKFLKGPGMLSVADDLTIQPFYMSSVICNEHGISMFDMEEFELKIGKKEALNILKASLTSKFALTNGLLNPFINVNVLMET
ncbi:hypothetical protein AAHA92_11241 [Salvia divinorum]|uniref:DUF674 family protein n=1 Tax=Salvia divinorum TaxID=28513 RepID=A0ABD1HGC7_SALDI